MKHQRKHIYGKLVFSFWCILVQRNQTVRFNHGAFHGAFPEPLILPCLKTYRMTVAQTPALFCLGHKLVHDCHDRGRNAHDFLVGNSASLACLLQNAFVLLPPYDGLPHGFFCPVVVTRIFRTARKITFAVIYIFLLVHPT